MARNVKFISNAAQSSQAAKSEWRNVKADRMSPELAEAFKAYWAAYDALVALISEKVGYSVNINVKRWSLGFIKREAKESNVVDFEL